MNTTMLVSATQTLFQNNPQLTSINSSPLKEQQLVPSQGHQVTNLQQMSPSTELNPKPNLEPTVLLCFHCGKMCSSAWDLVQHFSNFHSQIYAPGANGGTTAVGFANHFTPEIGGGPVSNGVQNDKAVASETQSTKITKPFTLTVSHIDYFLPHSSTYFIRRTQTDHLKLIFPKLQAHKKAHNG